MKQIVRLLKKFGQAVLSLFAVITFNFVLFRILPGDPIKLLARAGQLSAEAVARLRHVYGLDQSLTVQYLYYLRNIFTGELGVSMTYRRPVFEILQERIGNTLLLYGAATVIVITVGVIAGVLAAAYRGSRLDSAIVTGALMFWSFPAFWTGLVLIMIFGVYFRVFPFAGITTPGAHYASTMAAVIDKGRHLILPTLTLCLVEIGQFVLISRGSLIDVLTEDFILTAKAKGLSARQVLWRHALPNALLPIVTTSAIYIGLVIGGAIQTETVFSWPGMGRLMYDAVMRRDYPILEASFLVLAATVILANFLADLLYSYLDPRVRE